MNMIEEEKWLKQLYDELPAVVKPLLSISVFLIIFLFASKSLGLDNSFLFVTKEKVFNFSFYLGIFSLTYRALDKPFLEHQRRKYIKKYPLKKLNKTFFLGKYEDSNSIFVFELKNGKKKYWISNLKTKHYIWGHNRTQLINNKNKVTINNKKISLNKYRKGEEYDGNIDIVNQSGVSLVFLTITAIIIVLTLLL